MRRESKPGNDGVGHETANRRVFYDFTFSPPKSVSIAALVRDDTRIVTAHEQAVVAALNHLQIFAATRVRKNGQCTDRTTGTSWPLCSGTIRPRVRPALAQSLRRVQRNI